MSNIPAKGWLVIDGDGLSGLIRDIVQTEHDGKVLRAAMHQAGVSGGYRGLRAQQRKKVDRWHGLILRYSKKPPHRIRDETYRDLGRLVPRARVSELRATVFDEATELAYDIFEDWLTERHEASTAVMVPRSRIPRDEDIRYAEEGVGEGRTYDLIEKIRNDF